ncbi:MAG TPA: hypothetical protein VGD52_17250 [Pseudoduganella sp.]
MKTPTHAGRRFSLGRAMLLQNVVLTLCIIRNLPSDIYHVHQVAGRYTPRPGSGIVYTDISRYPAGPLVNCPSAPRLSALAALLAEGLMSNPFFNASNLGQISDT